MTAGPVRVYAFSPMWGLPTAGPFALKLIACLSMLGVPYELHFENDARKGPKRKSPWIEDGPVRMGDTELILRHLEATRGVSLDTHLDPETRARGLVLRRMLEEHFHQVFEYELIVTDEGWAQMRAFLERDMSPLVVVMVGSMLRRSFRKHLFERGVARHTPAEVELMGKADVDALVALLGDRPWFLGEQPTKTDASAFGLLAVAIKSDLPTPVCSYARAQPTLVRFVERALARFVPGPR
jgi:glutathione S-transferase